MKKIWLSAPVISLFMLLSAGVKAQQFEAVYSLEGVSSSNTKAAMEDLASDPAMKDGGVPINIPQLEIPNGVHCAALQTRAKNKVVVSLQ